MLSTVLCSLGKAAHLEYRQNISSCDITPLLTPTYNTSTNMLGSACVHRVWKAAPHSMKYFMEYEWLYFSANIPWNIKTDDSTGQFESFDCSGITIKLPCLFLKTLLSSMAAPLFKGQRPQVNSTENRIKPVYSKHKWWNKFTLLFQNTGTFSFKTALIWIL